tara:strand:- start:754 stop:1605 length:852 start_codon:yes stop_codon:yes gene_type:complete
MTKKTKLGNTSAKTEISKKTVKSTAPAPVIPTGTREVQLEKGTKWEMKDRTYVLKGSKTPITHMIPSSNIFWFDEEKGYERELKNTTNQKSPFVDEMLGGQHRMSHIVFEDGLLIVPRQKQVLQKLLSLYHPLKDVLYSEYNPVAQATYEVDNVELELEAMNAAVAMEIDMAEAIMRVEIGSKVSKMSSKELKRDLLMFAKNNPNLFLSLANDDNVHLRNIGVKATEMNIIKLSPDQRTFSWASNDRKLCTVPFDEHPYSALASWFKTDEGMEVFSTIEKRMN